MNRHAPIGKAGLELTKSYEKFSAMVYPDQGGHPTIGYGHKIKSGDNYGGAPLEMDQALLLLQRDVAWATDAITRLVDADVLDALNQNQYDALVSLVFNIGVGAFQESTFLSILNDGAGTLACRIDVAGLEFPRWNKATIDGEKVVSDGLVKRREAERTLWLTPVEPVQPKQEPKPCRCTYLVCQDCGKTYALLAGRSGHISPLKRNL